ncbi:hypothetical protein AAC387_Pa06g2091 [Persea americana]
MGRSYSFPVVTARHRKFKRGRWKKPSRACSGGKESQKMLSSGFNDREDNRMVCNKFLYVEGSVQAIGSSNSPISGEMSKVHQVRLMDSSRGFEDVFFCS